MVHPEKRLITTHLPTDFLHVARYFPNTRFSYLCVGGTHVFISLFFPDCDYIDLCKTRGIGLTAEPSNLREGGYETELPLIGLSNWTATIGYPIAPVLSQFCRTVCVLAVDLKS